MKKWFFRVIFVPTLILMGFTFQPALVVQAKEGDCYFDSESKTYYNVSDYADFKQAIDASNENGGGFTVYVTGDVVLEQMIYINASVRIIGDGGKHTITTNGYTSDYGNSFRINGSPGSVVFENLQFKNGRNQSIIQVMPGSEPGKLELESCDFSDSVCPVCFETTTIGTIRNCNFFGGLQGVVFREGRGNIIDCTFSDYDTAVLVTESIGVLPADNFTEEADGNIKVKKSQFKNCKDAGILVYPTKVISSKTYIEENDFINCRNGIVIYENEADVCNNRVSYCSQIGMDCIRGKMKSEGNVIDHCPIGIKSSHGEIISNNTNVADCSDYGAYIEGRFVQESGCIAGAKSVYQNGEYEVSGSATTKGDVYLASKERFIQVTSAPEEADLFVIDCADRSAGNVLVRVSYASGEAAEEICRSMIGKQFVLSKNLDGLTVKTEDGSLHKALLRGGRGDQSAEVENPERLPKDKRYTNGEEGSLVLSCELTVSYDISRFESIKELKGFFFSDTHSPEENHKSTAVYKEGFSSTDAAFFNDWMLYHNDTDGRMEIHSPVNALVTDKKYTSSYEENKSFVFLGWCLDKDGNGPLYQSASSFPMDHDYVWYPIFDVQYDLIYDGNIYNEKREILGGEVCMTAGKNTSSFINSEKGYRDAKTSDDAYIVPWKEDFCLWGNKGPDNDCNDYFKKSILVTDYDDRAKKYGEESPSFEYRYNYSYQGWSLNPFATYKDRESKDKTERVFSEGEYLTSTGNDADALKSRWEFFQLCESKGNVVYTNNRVGVKLYLVWDEYPELWSYDVSFTSGQIREYDSESFQKELLKQVDDQAKEGVYTHDFEDANAVELSVLDYDYERFSKVGDWNIVGGEDEDEFEVILCAKDGAGNVSKYGVMAHITSEDTIRTNTEVAESAIYYRAINQNNWEKNPYWKEIMRSHKNILGCSDSQLKDLCEKYTLWICDKDNYKKAKDAYENGGMEPYSKWYIDPKLVRKLWMSFEAL